MSTEYRVYELNAEPPAPAGAPARPGKIVRVALAPPTPPSPVTTNPAPHDASPRTARS